MLLLLFNNTRALAGAVLGQSVTSAQLTAFRSLVGEERISELRVELGLGARAKARPKRHISKAGRARIAAAQRKRWAAANGKKAQQRATPQAAALKKRWAAFRAGTGPRPGATEPKPERKKVEWTPAMRKKAAERMRRVNKEKAKRRAAVKEAA